MISIVFKARVAIPRQTRVYYIPRIYATYALRSSRRAVLSRARSRAAAGTRQPRRAWARSLDAPYVLPLAPGGHRTVRE